MIHLLVHQIFKWEFCRRQKNSSRIPTRIPIGIADDLCFANCHSDLAGRDFFFANTFLAFCLWVVGRKSAFHFHESKSNPSNYTTYMRAGIPTSIYNRTTIFLKKPIPLKKESQKYFKKIYLASLDTGHFFHISPIRCLICLGIVWCQESKIWTFFKDLRSFRGPQKQKRKNIHNSIIFGSKIKVRSNFIWEKLMEFLLFKEVLKNLIFF